MLEYIKGTIKWVGIPLAVGRNFQLHQEQIDLQKEILKELRDKPPKRDPLLKKTDRWEDDRYLPVLNLRIRILRNTIADKQRTIERNGLVAEWLELRKRCKAVGLKDPINYMPRSRSGDIIGTPKILRLAYKKINAALEPLERKKQYDRKWSK